MRRERTEIGRGADRRVQERMMEIDGEKKSAKLGGPASGAK